MELVQLVYFSRSLIRPSTGSLRDEVAKILAVSVARNKQVDVTGGLLYDGTWFAQVLEGARENVAATFDRIKADPRHRDIALVGTTPMSDRRFPYWWMGGGAWGRGMAELFRKRRGKTHFDPRGMTADELVDFIAEVIERQSQRAVKPSQDHNEVASGA